MGFDLDISVPALTVFVQGILSFLSPCVLPLLPVYIGQLAGGGVRRQDDGTLVYDGGRVFLHTLFFVIGISFSFLLLGLAATAFAGFFGGNRQFFERAGGIIVILFGLLQLGVFDRARSGTDVLSRDHRLPFSAEKLTMSPLTALLLGFLFSFAWTPCVGPVLTSVLLMAASSTRQAQGLLLILVYTLGFVLPFLATGLAATAVVSFFRRHKDVVRYSVRAGGVLLVLMGLLMVSGRMGDISAVLAIGG